ncbi:MAG: phage terminase small subunit P27 family [bacterium]|nr:phage terminase small subunit P27 family [bacterium]
MGRRGPPPKPTYLKAVRGNPGKRPLNENEPKPPKDAPRCPVWLSAEAKTVWRRVVPMLERMGVLTLVDGDALNGYCQTYARWKKAEEFLEKHGDVYPLRDEQGRVRCMQQFPQVAISRNLLQLLKSYQQEFGLTPSARSRIELPKPNEDSPLQRMRRRRRG